MHLISAKINPFHYVMFLNELLSLFRILYNQYFTSDDFILPTLAIMFFILINYKCGHRNVLSKRQVWMSIFHIINFKKKKIVDTGVLDFLIKN